LAGEVPRLLLKEYEASRHSNRKLEDMLEQLRKENRALKETNLRLEEELAKLRHSNKLVTEEFSDVFHKY